MCCFLIVGECLEMSFVDVFYMGFVLDGSFYMLWVFEFFDDVMFYSLVFLLFVELVIVVV